MNELNLVSKIAEGDREAENYLFSSFREKIYFLVRSRSRGRIPLNDQEDIISETYQAILLSLRRKGFDPSLGKPLEAYIAGITANIVAQYFRKLEKGRTSEDIERISEKPVSENALTEIINEERKEILRSCLNRLEKKYREILVLRIYEGKSITEISEQLGIENRRVSERIHYALKLMLKECRKEKYFQYSEGSDK